MKTLFTGAIAALLISAPAFAGGDPQAGQAKAQVCAGCHGAQG
ncbi:MAG TPA: cytochrome c, partial [Gammaproteobacteria bacterium]|nr:cytochrome c [Gammaproteobacteria bacterium]